ncbi:glutamate ABC transporter substrate-binding protein [Actinomadura roseirufa]|uniref:glutamate ABC transporter substrate-binding protein n=1 Tax=Actinomadura roseirufa TaxID=2094049 RepID=UPI001F5FAE66|nr:glutamate ABC transporter substrate-binding protein [Actinomadura roseirufa]
MVAVASLGLTGCTATATASVSGKSAIVVGVKADQPGLGFKAQDGTYSGFEVDVGRYIADHMGASRVTFKTVTSDNREDLLRNHTVDIVLASYSITPDRAREVTFGGPYYVAHQDIMVHRDETRIRSVRDLTGRTMCKASGSVSTERIVEGLGIKPRLAPAPSYSDCVAKLLDGTVDVVSTGDLVLAGFAARNRSRVKILNAPFTDEPYGVGLRNGDIDGCEGVNRALTRMYQDGTAIRLLQKWFGASGITLNPEVPEYEGCS